jgi:hypothetical protein
MSSFIVGIKSCKSWETRRKRRRSRSTEGEKVGEEGVGFGAVKEGI